MTRQQDAVNQFGHDIGGFLGSPDAELFIRWLQFGSWTPFLRNHSIDTSNAREPWMFGEANTPIVRRAIEERYRLLPWFYSLFDASSRTGIPKPSYKLG